MATPVDMTTILWQGLSALALGVGGYFARKRRRDKLASELAETRKEMATRKDIEETRADISHVGNRVDGLYRRTGRLEAVSNRVEEKLNLTPMPLDAEPKTNPGYKPKK